MKIIIVGGVAGGATTAARLRRNDEKAEITLFEKGSHISYANCGLPYYIGNTISERETLFLQTPESFSKKFNLSVKVNTEVKEIDRKNKTIKAENLKTGEIYEEKYDKLLLSPGAVPVKPPITGIDSENIFTLRNVEDTDSIKSKIENSSPRRAVVVGAGFIGLEVAENLHNLGIRTTIVEMADQVMAPLDYELAAEVHQHLKIKGVEFYLGDSVVAFKSSGDREVVELKSGKKIEADLIILSIGVKPLSTLAEKAGLEISQRGAIVVNDYLQTEDTDIYAVGDAVEFKNPITGKPALPYLAGPANRQGRIAADNIIFGNTRKYSGAVGSGIAKIFDISAASSGLNEKALKAEKIPYESVITHGSSHAGYYPGALPMTLKTLFSPGDGKLLGAQIVGFEGVDKRIDLFSVILKNRGSIYDLQEIEHAYAPPFSSAKDPVNIAGYAAENILKDKVSVICWRELRDNLDSHTIVDVRTPEEISLGTIEGAVNIPLDELRNRMTELDKKDSIVVVCAVGLRGYLAARILSQNGFENVKNLSGGYKTYALSTDNQSNEDIFENEHIDKDDMIYSTAPGSVGSKKDDIETLKIDACGLQCPGPIMQLKKSMDKLEPGKRVEITATDQGFLKDSESWCSVTGNKLVEKSQNKGRITAVIEKTAEKKELSKNENGNKKGHTIIVFNDDLDRALASFVIANGAASMGKKVTMFFTFWGLNVIKKEGPPPVKKDFMGKMFGMMLPSSSRKLSLSKMSMGGLGTQMMRNRMKNLNIDSLESMIKKAAENGVEMIACQMSMDVMGVKAEELSDNVKIGGVASYLEHAENAGVNLFI
ncbi:MAG: FAD-dependent oxidoreductase [bacterium]